MRPSHGAYALVQQRRVAFAADISVFSVRSCSGQPDSLSEIHLMPNALPHTDTSTPRMKQNTEGYMDSRRALHMDIQHTALRRKHSLSNSHSEISTAAKGTYVSNSAASRLFRPHRAAYRGEDGGFTV